jgi:fermentation-respiration switch protein FrsA (DUF1100 family)
VLGAVAFIFVARCALLWWMQDAIVFPRSLANSAPGLPAPPEAEVWTLETEAGPVEAWFVPASGASPDSPAPAVVFCHGNGERIDHNGHMAAMYAEMGFATLLVEYRGYGASAGEPSQRALVADTTAFVERLAARDDIDGARIVYHGRSIGAAVLFQVARERPPAAMIAESAFTSAVALAHRQLAPGFLLRHPFRSDRVARSMQAPLLLFHGERDEIVPVSHARRLHDMAARSELVIQPAGHNDFPSDAPAYRAAIEAFLKAAGIPPSPEQSLQSGISRVRSGGGGASLGD